MLKRMRARKAAKKVRNVLGTANVLHIMATSEWAIMTIGTHAVCRLSKNDIQTLLDLMSDKNEIREGMVGEVFE